MNRFEKRFTFQGEPQKEARVIQHPSMSVAFVGNPNSGKTTLFNALTGATLKTANWPGVTVEGKEGLYDFEGHLISLLDLPGTYSLTSYTTEEEVTRTAVFAGDADVIVDVVDASCLERSLYLTLELLALKKPVVVALNMMDVAQKRGLEIDTHRLAEILGAPVIPLCARKRQGLQTLMHAAYHHKNTGLDPIQHDHDFDDGMPQKHLENVVVYTAALEQAIDQVQAAFEERYPHVVNARWFAIKLLEKDKRICSEYPLVLPDALQPPEKNVTFEQVFIRERYDFIQDVIHECVFNNHKVAFRSDKIDRVLTNAWAGIPLFLAIMALVFFLTFFVGDAIKFVFEQGLDALNTGVAAALGHAGVSSGLISLICDGILSGVGTVLTFLPNIFILFLALAVLEDSGYMSRVAYNMDAIMSHVGLSGRAFIPMILGFGCTVPAILSTRTLERTADRKRVMFVTPFMSCSARLPIYVLFAGLFFAHGAALVAFSMYLLGIVVALFSLLVMHLYEKHKNPAVLAENALLIELPEYKLPDAYSVWIYVWEKVKDYLVRAGTVIFVASIVIWFLMNVGPHGFVEGAYEGSFAALLGRAIAPLLAPLGAGDWRFAVALLAGISAKEVVVSSLSVLFGVAGSAVGSSVLYSSFLALGFGPANALGFMTFCLLYTPCIAAIATIASESKSKGFALLTAFFQLVVAWGVATLVFQIAHLFL